MKTFNNCSKTASGWRTWPGKKYRQDDKMPSCKELAVRALLRFLVCDFTDVPIHQYYRFVIVV